VLVEFGWDEPDTAFLRRHIATMERTPFDGCVYHVAARGKAGQLENFSWKFWGNHAFTESDLAPALDDLKATPFARFKHNFLRVNTAPAELDWFDDHAAVLANARLAAKVAREGRSRGVLLDTEQYEGQLFNYRKQKHASSKSWDDYASQARLRGRDVMSAFQEGFPGLTVLLTFGPSLVAAKTRDGKVAESEYGLLAPFLEGMSEARRGGSVLVDGHEPSYKYKKPEQFDEALGLIRKSGPSFRAGFGLWLDYDWRKLGWNTADVSLNYFSPEAFEKAVRSALERSDEIVWVYTESPRWWSVEDGRPSKLPDAYVEALRKARKGLTAD
jgi:hypothetical protein